MQYTVYHRQVHCPTDRSTDRYTLAYITTDRYTVAYSTTDRYTVLYSTIDRSTVSTNHTL